MDDDKVDPDSIVVAVDGSQHADRAVGWAAEQAALEDRPLTVVAVGRGAQTTAATALDLVGRLEHPPSARAWRTDGDPRAVLVELTTRVPLVVMGSRGRGSFRSLLGSVSTAVTRQAACPVVVCRPRADASFTPGIVVGADGTAESGPVLDFAFRQASLRGLPLTVVHTSWDVVAAMAELHAGPDARPPTPEAEELRLVLAESVAGFTERFPDVAVELEVRYGLVDEKLSPRGHARDLIVVGRHPMTTVGRILTGSVATAVVERSQSSVAVVPVPAPSGGR